MPFQVFHNKISGIALFIMGLCYVILIARAIIGSFESQLPEKQPITFNHVELNDTVLEPGSPLVLKIDGAVNQRGCQSYSLRTIVDKVSKQEIWVTVTPISPVGTLEDEIEKKKIIVIEIPRLKNGNYSYRNEIHQICDKKSYITITPLLDFTIVEQTNDKKSPN